MSRRVVCLDSNRRLRGVLEPRHQRVLWADGTVTPATQSAPGAPWMVERDGRRELTASLRGWPMADVDEAHRANACAAVATARRRAGVALDVRHTVPTYPGWWWLEDAPILVWSNADPTPLWVTLPGSGEAVRVEEVSGWDGPCLREAR